MVAKLLYSLHYRPPGALARSLTALGRCSTSLRRTNDRAIHSFQVPLSLKRVNDENEKMQWLPGDARRHSLMTDLKMLPGAPIFLSQGYPVQVVWINFLRGWGADSVVNRT